MKIIDGALISETSELPGGAGDSCAETARRYLTLRYLQKDVTMLNLKQFRTDRGYIRSPLVKDLWGEEDQSTDQNLPLFLAYIMDYPELAQEMYIRISSNYFRTGNGDFISPLFLAELKNWPLVRHACVKAQALIFKIPYRWSDAQNWIEKSEGSTADYLNLIFCMMRAGQTTRRLFQPGLLIEKVASYYAGEPNNSETIDLYTQLITKNFY